MFAFPRLTPARAAALVFAVSLVLLAPPLAMCYEPPAFRFKDLPP